MAYCIDCKKELNDNEVKNCEILNLNGLYCDYHLVKLKNTWKNYGLFNG